MAYYGIEQYFWLKLIVLVSILGFSILFFDVIMRKILGLKKEKLFTNSHVNALHKKIDWIIRIIFIVAMIVGAIYNVSRQPMERFLILEPYAILLILTYITEMITAAMQWKYVADKKESILTICRLVFITVLLFILYTTDFFGL